MVNSGITTKKASGEEWYCSNSWCFYRWLWDCECHDGCFEAPQWWQPRRVSIWIWGEGCSLKGWNICRWCTKWMTSSATTKEYQTAKMPVNDSCDHAVPMPRKRRTRVKRAQFHYLYLRTGTKDHLGNLSVRWLHKRRKQRRKQRRSPILSIGESNDYHSLPPKKKGKDDYHGIYSWVHQQFHGENFVELHFLRSSWPNITKNFRCLTYR